VLVVLFVAFLLLMILGVPVAFALAMASFGVILAFGKYPLSIVAIKMVDALDSFPLLAIPFFILAGTVMERGGISRSLVDLGNAIMRGVRGGLGMAAVLASMIFAGISGSAVADASAVGSITIPAMLKQGYKRGCTASLMACAGALGPIIPPSLLVIIYASIMELSVGAMFLSGLVPGLLIGFGLMGICYAYSFVPGYEELTRARGRFSLEELGTAFVRAVPALILPGIVLGGIFGGVFTATEAGVVAAAYALVLAFVTRQLRLRDLRPILVDSALVTATITLILAGATILNWIMAAEDFEGAVLGWLQPVATTPTRFILTVIGFLLVLGMFMEMLSVMIILVPLLHGMAMKMGFDALQFSMIVIIVVLIGAITPPLGVLLYLTCRMSGARLEETFRYVYPFLLPLLLMVLLMAFWPPLATFVPKLFGYTW
jgi:C4-dicarboxylate transporter DctM subunit